MVAVPKASANRPDILEAPSGKGARDENFPVASVLIAPKLRPCVMAFYNFARAADDIADTPDLTRTEKIDRLNAFEAGLADPLVKDTKPSRLASALAAQSLGDEHPRRLLTAFRQDAVKSRYASINELIDYCQMSADPVGRFLLDLHGEDPALYPASDALCTVLQILNHLQDLGKDYREIDRVYLPQDWMVEAGVELADLTGEQLSPGLRRVVDRCLTICEDRLLISGTLAPRLQNRRLAAEAAVIQALAVRLARHLRDRDPLKHRIKLSKLDFGAAALKGVFRLIHVGR